MRLKFELFIVPGRRYVSGSWKSTTGGVLLVAVYVSGMFAQVMRGLGVLLLRRVLCAARVLFGIDRS